jgi:hypothetical protein
MGFGAPRGVTGPTPASSGKLTIAAGQQPYAPHSTNNFTIDALWQHRIKVAGLALRLSHRGINKNNIAGWGYGNGPIIKGRCKWARSTQC